MLQVTETFALAYYAAAALALAAAMFAWRRRGAVGGTWLSLMMFACTEWALALALEATMPAFSDQLVFAKASYLGSSSVGVFFIFFALEFTERRRWLRPGLVAALMTVPLIALGLASTNEVHHLVWTSISAPPLGGHIHIYHHGPAYWAIAVFVLGTTALAGAMLVNYAVRSQGVYRWQSIEIIVAVAIPWVAFVVQASAAEGQMVLDAAAWLSLTGSILAFSILRHHLLDLLPIAREVLFDELPDGVLVLDVDGRVVDVNRAFERLVALPVPVGAQAIRVLEDLPNLRDLIQRRGQDVTAVEISAAQGLALSVECLALREPRSGSGAIGGWLVVARNVTAYRQAQDRVDELNEQLERKVVSRTASLTEALHRLRTLSAQVLLTEDRERRRLAEELHDRVSQSLSVAHLRISSARAKGECAAGELQTIDELLAQAMRETRAITTEIAPTMLYELGLPAALESLAEWLEVTHGIAVVVSGGEGLDLGEEQSATLLRSARELLMNVVKHAGTDCAWVTLRVPKGGGVELEVRDKGVGLVGPTEREGSFGLFSIRERVAHLGGSLEVRPATGGGTVAIIAIPSGNGRGEAEG